MRDKIECGIFFLESFGSWVDEFIEETHRQTNRIQLFKIDVQQFLPCNDFEVGGHQFPHPNALRELAIIFERYDCLIIPVLPETLVWTRVSLAQITHPLQFPLIALPHHVQPLAFMDLATLGIGEYIFEQDDVSIMRIRLSNIIDRHKAVYTPLHKVLRKSQEFFTTPMNNEHQTIPLNLMMESTQKPKATRKRRRSTKKSTSDKVIYSDPFQIAKAKVIKEFEKNYVVHALMETKGNICAAAQRSHKHRRAFWGLMRKHEIDAEDYRVET